jgi:hypothetical protein
MANKKPPLRRPAGARIGDLVSWEHRVNRAAGDLRRGVPVLIRATRTGESALAVAAETADDRTLRALSEEFGAPTSVLTHDRAATL